MVVRRIIKDYVIANPASSEADIVAACDATERTTRRAPTALARLISEGRIIKDGDSHTWWK